MATQPTLTAIFEPFADALGPENCAFVGPDKVDSAGRPPRISWNPIEADHLAARRTGGLAGDDGPILTRRWLIQIDIRGKNLDDTERLADLFLATAHDLLSQHTYKPGKEQWNPGGVTANGSHCLMVIAIERPVLRTPAITQTIGAVRAAFKVNGAASGPTSTFTKEP